MENDTHSWPPSTGSNPAPAAPVPPPRVALNPTPPPVIFPPTPPPPTGRGWRIATLILAAALTLSLLANLGGLLGALVGGLPLASPPASDTDALVEVVVEDNHAPHKIALVDIGGLITSDNWDGSGNLVQLVQDQLERAAANRSVKAVLLKVDSPGGEVLASDDIAAAIRKFQESSGKPVVAALGSLAASGGYYVSAPCRWIVAHELTITGSIGVIMHGYNYRGLLTKVGIRPDVYKSGKFKDMLSGDKADDEIHPEERRMIQTLIDDTFARFKSVVREGRSQAAKHNPLAAPKNRPLTDDWTELADGRILSGRQAFEAGFVDELGNFETAVERACNIAGIPKANLVRYQRPFEFGHLLRFLGRAPDRQLKVQVGPDLPRLQAGRLYFLAPTALP